MILPGFGKLRNSLHKIFLRASSSSRLILIGPITISTLLTLCVKILANPKITFDVQINDPFISTSSNVGKLNSLLGNTRSDPTLVNYLTSPRFICTFTSRVVQFRDAETNLSNYIRKQCKIKKPFGKVIKATFSKGERYEDLQVIRFEFQTNNPGKDISWVSAFSRYVIRQSEQFSLQKIVAVNKAIKYSENQSAREARSLREKLFDLIRQSNGPLDESYKLYTDQLAEIEKARVSYLPKRTELIASIASQLNVTPTRASKLLFPILSLNKDEVQPLINSLQDINVRLAKFKTSGNTKSFEYRRTLILKDSLIKQIANKSPGFSSLVALLPNPTLVPDLVSVAVKVRSLDLELQENIALSTKILKQLEIINKRLPEYTLLKSKIEAQDKAISAAAEDNEELKIELSRVVGTWDVINGPYSVYPSLILIWFASYLVAVISFVFYTSRDLLISKLIVLINK